MAAWVRTGSNREAWGSLVRAVGRLCSKVQARRGRGRVHHDVVCCLFVRSQVATPWHPTIKEAWGRKVVRELPEREKDALMTMNPNTPT